MSRKERIEEILIAQFSPTYLNVEDESHQHHVPKDAQTHFKITMAADEFTPLGRIDRHRLINKLLKNDFDNGMHALSMYLYSPHEWELKRESVPNSPSCRDGYKNK